MVWNLSTSTSLCMIIGAANNVTGMAGSVSMASLDRYPWCPVWHVFPAFGISTRAYLCLLKGGDKATSTHEIEILKVHK